MNKATYLALTGATVFGVLVFGAGVTLASPDTSSDVPIVETSTTPAPQANRVLPTDIEEGGTEDCYDWVAQEWNQDCLGVTQEKQVRLIESEWTGTKFNFTEDGIYLVWSGLPTVEDQQIDISFGVNGGQRFSLNSFCTFPREEKTCGSWQSYTIEVGYFDFPNASCKAEGDTYLVTVIGAGLNFSETGLIPDGVIDCPSRPLAPAPQEN